MEKLKKYKGITLISLILTIIILIIISGITISMLLGNDGIINRARYAKDSYTNATNDEQEKLNDLENLFSKILVGSNSTVELSMEQLNEYIDQRVNQKLSETNTANPLGTIIAYYGDTAPTGYLPCDGTSRNTTDYSELASFLGATGDTFNLPDLRGEFLRGAGTNSHANQGSGGAVRTHQDATKHIFLASDPSSPGSFYLPKVSGETISSNNYDWTNTAGAHGYAGLTLGSGAVTKNYTSRPTNTSVLYCIKY